MEPHGNLMEPYEILMNPHKNFMNLFIWQFDNFDNFLVCWQFWSNLLILWHLIETYENLMEPYENLIEPH